MPNTFLIPVKSVMATQFTEALAGGAAPGTPGGASAMYDLVGLPPAIRRVLIRAILVETTENFGPEINIFQTNAGKTTTPLTDTFVGRFGFLKASGQQLAAAGLWRYYVDGLAIPYVDLDTTGNANASQAAQQGAPTIHVTLDNIDTVAKLAFVAGNPPVGAAVVTLTCEPMATY